MGSARTTFCGSLTASLAKLAPLVHIRIVSVLSNHLGKRSDEPDDFRPRIHLFRLAYNLVSHIGVSLGQAWLTANRDAT